LACDKKGLFTATSSVVYHITHQVSFYHVPGTSSQYFNVANVNYTDPFEPSIQYGKLQIPASAGCAPGINPPLITAGDSSMFFLYRCLTGDGSEWSPYYCNITLEQLDSSGKANLCESLSPDWTILPCERNPVPLIYNHSTTLFFTDDGALSVNCDLSSNCGSWVSTLHYLCYLPNSFP